MRLVVKQNILKCSNAIIVKVSIGRYMAMDFRAFFRSYLILNLNTRPNPGYTNTDPNSIGNADLTLCHGSCQTRRRIRKP